MAPCLLRTFGGLTLERDGRPVEGLTTQRRALGLLAAIAAAGQHGLGRDQAMLLLWPESTTTRARGSLKQLLHALRRQLGDPDAIDGVAELRLNPLSVTSDVARFHDAIAAGDDATAVRLYGGPFLDGVHLDDADEFERWAAQERERLARAHAEALERLATSATARGRKTEALAWWRRLHAVEPLNARVTVGLMEALDAAGDRAAALQVSRTHEALLREELGVPPDPAVVAVADALRPGRPVEALSPARPPHEATRPETPGRPLRSRPLLRTIAVLAIVATVAIAVFVLRPPAGTGNLLPNRVAVAVFVNRTGTLALDPLGTMASDWVTRGLSQNSLVDVFEVGGLYLAGRAADGAPADPRALARANGAGLVVAGNYYRSGDSLMFSVQVIDVASGRVRRAIDPIGGAVDDPLSVVEEVRQRVVVALGLILDPRAGIFDSPALALPRYDAFEAFVAGQERYWKGDWAGSLPLFRRAAELDTGFTTALVSLGVAGVGTARCDLADSVLDVLSSRQGRVREIDMLTARISVARCASDHAELNRLHRQRAALMPGSKSAQLMMSTGFRQLNRPAEALAILASIDPARDLGWLPEQGRSFYWREVGANRHALGDYRAERAFADRMRQAGAAPLAVGLIQARSLAALGMADSALAVLDAVADAPPDPALLSGITGGLSPVELATPGWMMYQIALELAAHGQESAARAAADHSIAWFSRRASGEPLPPAGRFVLARALEFTGDFAGARTLLARLAENDTANLDFRGMLGVLAVREGDQATAMKAEAWLTAQETVFPPGLPLLYRAEMAALRGDTSLALDLVDALPQRAHPHDFLQFHLDPAFVPIRGTERFRRLLAPKG